MDIILHTAPVKANNTQLIIASSKSDWAKLGFSREEAGFIDAEIKSEKKFVEINRFSSYVFLQLFDTGKKEKYFDLESLRKAGDKFTARLNGLKKDQIIIVDEQNDKDYVLAFVEGMSLGNYQFLKHRKEQEKEKNKLTKVSVKSKNIKQNDLDLLKNLVEATCIARDLVNEPSNFQSATQLSEEFKKMGKAAGFKVEVLNKNKIESLKMGGLLSVNIGSVEPPTFTIMEYKPAKPLNKKPYVLVGKGVVYDTGGLSLKPTAGMDTMKCDMGGGAAVGAAMYAIAKSKLNVHVIALVPATDNRPGGNAYAPGDVITMYDGSTVEVLNTDAEGRLILADALSYAKKYKPELVMDFATLTGAAVAAIGSYGIVTMGTASEEVKAKLKNSGNSTYERLAEMPFWDEYDDLIKSDIADMKNIGGPTAGAITAGKFLARYIDYPWMHFDIAGPAFLKGNDSYRGKNGTGVGVRFLFDFFRNLS